MKIADIKVLTEVYAVAPHRGNDLDSANAQGIVLSTTAWRSRRSDRGRFVIEPNPDGKGYGRTGSGFDHRTRGLPVLVVSEYGLTREGIEQRHATLSDVASHLDLGSVHSTDDVPHGYKIVLLRPQAIVATWAEKLEYRAQQRDQRLAEQERRETERNRQDVAYKTLLAVLGGADKLPRGYTGDYTLLLEFAETYHEAKLARAEQRAAEAHDAGKA